MLHSAVLFGIVGAGGVYVGCSSASPRHELDHLVALSQPRIILTTSSALSKVQDVCTARGICSSRICVVDERAIMTLVAFAKGQVSTSMPPTSAQKDLSPFRLEELLCHGQTDWMRIDSEEEARVTPACMFTTSGTSGLPKAAIRTHHTIISQHESVHYTVPYSVRRLMALPMSHSFGDYWANLFPLRYGEPLFILPRFDLTEFLAAVQEHQITETYLVPAAVHIIIQTTLPVGERLASLRYIGVSGAPIDGASIERCQSRLHRDAFVGQLWGMSEVGVVFQNRYGDSRHPGGIGTLLAPYEIRLVQPDNGETLVYSNAKLEPTQPHNQMGAPASPTGELYVRGPGVLLGYQGRDGALELDGWFRTGDLAYAHDSHYVIIGRTKELIKVRGYSVAPAEIEALLMQKEPRVRDVAVIGVSLPDGSSELPRAYIVPASKQTPRMTQDQICMLVRQHLASYKAPDGGVIFVEDIPRTAIGKPHRSKLARLDAERDRLEAILVE